MECTSDWKNMQIINKNEQVGVAIYGWKDFCMIEVRLVSMGPLAEWGPGQIAPVAPPLGGPECDYGILILKFPWCLFIQYILLVLIMEV